MDRMHLLELEDLDAFPAVLRDRMTEFLNHIQNLLSMLDPVLPVINEALEAGNTNKIVDMCSGSGGAWPSLLERFDDKTIAEVLLTDINPNSSMPTTGRMRMHPESVDATDVPPEFEGVRTIFNGFHHLPPKLAKAVLADAARKKRPIVIVEIMERNWLNILGGLSVIPAAVWATSFFMKPFRLSRLLLTYALPVLPAAVAFDGTVSAMRIYSPAEVKEMTNDLDNEGYVWRTGLIPQQLLPANLTYIIGKPATPPSK